MGVADNDDNQPECRLHSQRCESHGTMNVLYFNFFEQQIHILPRVSCNNKLDSLNLL